MLILRTTLAFLLTSPLTGCSTLPPQIIQDPVAAEALWSLTYHDGSGNGFRFWKESEGDDALFEYVPIRPERSSSGLYSGGEPKKGTLDDERVKELWQWARRLESDASIHVNSRRKGSGAFSLRSSDGVRDFMVKNGPLLRKFNELLVPFRDD